MSLDMKSWLLAFDDLQIPWGLYSSIEDQDKK